MLFEFFDASGKIKRTFSLQAAPQILNHKGWDKTTLNLVKIFQIVVCSNSSIAISGIVLGVSSVIGLHDCTGHPTK